MPMGTPPPPVAIDFGTTNTAVGIAAADGSVRLVPLPMPGGDTAQLWRTVLFFEDGQPTPSAGAGAIARYLETGGEGRLVQSIKSHLASASFGRPQIFGRTYTLEALIAAYLRAVRTAASASGVDLGRRCVCGRPVRYWGAETDDDDARAEGRMRQALAIAGFDEVVFEFEPIGAAASYAARLPAPELIVVADFGGGTTDFSVVRVGPGVEPGDPRAVLASGGLGVSGDAFDARIIDARVAPPLGRGSRYRADFSGEAPVPPWLYANLRRWHHLSFLKAPDTMRLLHRVEDGAVEPRKIARLMRLIDEDLGLSLHRAVEGTKVALSRADAVQLVQAELELDEPATRAEFDAWIEDDLAAIDAVLLDVLARAGVDASQIDRVFATGGTSMVPAVRARLAARFGAAKVASGEELTSVAWGLAARARVHFGA